MEYNALNDVNHILTFFHRWRRRCCCRFLSASHFWETKKEEEYTRNIKWIIFSVCVLFYFFIILYRFVAEWNKNVVICVHISTINDLYFNKKNFKQKKKNVPATGHTTMMVHQKVCIMPFEMILTKATPSSIISGDARRVYRVAVAALTHAVVRNKTLRTLLISIEIAYTTNKVNDPISFCVDFFFFNEHTLFTNSNLLFNATELNYTTISMSLKTTAEKNCVVCIYFLA